jgi:hypothetical protein
MIDFFCIDSRSLLTLLQWMSHVESRSLLTKSLKLNTKLLPTRFYVDSRSLMTQSLHVAVCPFLLGLFCINFSSLSTLCDGLRTFIKLTPKINTTLILN